MGVAVGSGVAVGVGDGVGLAVAVGVRLGIRVAVGVNVAVGVGWIVEVGTCATDVGSSSGSPFSGEEQAAKESTIQMHSIRVACLNLTDLPHPNRML